MSDEDLSHLLSEHVRLSLALGFSIGLHARDDIGATSVPEINPCILDEDLTDGNPNMVKS